jgi:anti-anti-sigma factor
MKTRTEAINRLLIELDGDFWGPNALDLAKRLPVGDLASARQVVLSFEKVRHMDQAGLAMLVRLYSHLRVRGSDLQLVDVPSVVLELLERVGLAELVSCAEGLEHEPAHHTIALGARAKA